MVKPRKLSDSEKAIKIINIIGYLIGTFIGLSILFFFLEYSGVIEEFRLKFMEMFNI